jgi:3-phenylpropionate/trans-cinnamate dioxygenase ferredoxin component
MTKHEVGTETDFPEGVLKQVEVDGRSLLVVRIEGALHAMDGKCSHMGYDLSRGRLDDHTVTCRLHGATFDLLTGEVIRNMAAKPMRVYPLSVESNRVFIDI